MARTIQCEDCGSDYRTHRSNTRYCAFHRFYRDYMYSRREPKQVECHVCGDAFLPVRRSVVICSRCYPPPASYGREQCALCTRMCNQVHQDVKLCGPCVESPTLTKEVTKLLVQKNKWLIRHPAKENPTNDR